MSVILAIIFSAALLPSLSDAAPGRFKRQTQCSRSYPLSTDDSRVSVNAVQTCSPSSSRYPNNVDWTFTLTNIQNYGSDVYVNVYYSTGIESHSYCSWDKLTLGSNLANPVTICGQQSGSFSVRLQSWENTYVVRFTSDSSVTDSGFQLTVSRSSYPAYRTTNLPKYTSSFSQDSTPTTPYYNTTPSYNYTTGSYYTTTPYYNYTTGSYYNYTTPPYNYTTGSYYTTPYYNYTTGSYYNYTTPPYNYTTGSYYNYTTPPYNYTTGSYYTTPYYNYTTGSYYNYTTPPYNYTTGSYYNYTTPPYNYTTGSYYNYTTPPYNYTTGSYYNYTTPPYNYTTGSYYNFTTPSYNSTG